MSLKYKYAAVSDYSAYDSSQLAWHARIEHKLIKTICGARAAHLWSYFVLGTVRLDNQGVTYLLPQQLQSGKLFTSLTNTYSNQLYISYAF